MTRRSAASPATCEQRVADVEVAGLDMLDVDLDAVTGEIERDVGARDVAMAEVGRPGVDAHHLDR
jgi:hypothetical protein